MDSNREYTETHQQMTKDESAIEYGVTIPVTIPTMGTYTMEDLKYELTKFAMCLVTHTEKKVVSTKQYSAKLQRLLASSQNRITVEDISNDDRLAYLINK